MTTDDVPRTTPNLAAVCVGAARDLLTRFEPGDRVLYVAHGEPCVATVRAVDGPAVVIEPPGALTLAAECTLLAPAADAPVAEVVNVLGAAVALAVAAWRAAPAGSTARGVALARIYTPMFENVPGAVGTLTGSTVYLATHEAAPVGCVGDTPREALRWLASELYHQRAAVAGDADPLVRWAAAQLAALCAPVRTRAELVDVCTGQDPIAVWYAAVTGAPAPAPVY